MRGSPRCEAGSVPRRERESLRSYLEVSKAIRQVELENRRQMRPKVGLASTWHGRADAHFARVVPSILRPLLILSAHRDISIPKNVNHGLWRMTAFSRPTSAVVHRMKPTRHDVG